MNADYDVIVVGAGFGGLAAALICASAGYQTLVVEKNSQAGGKAYRFSLGEAEFDAGPSLFTLKSYFADVFERSGANIDDYLDLVELPEITRYWFDDGSRLESCPGSQFINRIEEFSPGSGEQAQRYLDYAKKMYEISEPLFLRNPLEYWKKGGFLSAIKQLFKLRHMDLGRSMHKANAFFFEDPRLVQLFDRFATYNGSDPYQAPATLNCISWVEHGYPVFMPRGGIADIPLALEKRGRELGVEYLYDAQVMGLEGDDYSYVMSISGGTSLKVSAKAVISDVDISTWYQDITGEVNHSAYLRYRKLTPSSSAVVFYWDMDASFPEFGLHNILFSGDYQAEFRQIHREDILPEDPTVYVHISSKVCTGDAREGGENWFVMVNAPPHTPNRDWDAEVEALRTKVVAKIEQRLGRKITPHIAAERVLNPSIIASETGSFRGALYGISSNSRTSAFMRHPNRSPHRRGVYHCGGSVHPGGGMPLTIQSGIIAADACIDDLKDRDTAPPPAIQAGKMLAFPIALAVMLIMYGVGVLGHAWDVTLPLMKFLTPWILFSFAGVCMTGIFMDPERTGQHKRRVALWLGLTWAATFALEVLGVATGAVFGAYHYGSGLGFHVLGVPPVIGLNWSIIVLGIAETLRVWKMPWYTAVTLTGAVAVGFDVILEPVAISARLDYWTWVGGAIPLQNYVAWFVIAGIFAAVYLLMTAGESRSGITKRQAEVLSTQLVSSARKYFPGWYVLIQFLYLLVMNIFVAR